MLADRHLSAGPAQAGPAGPTPAGRPLLSAVGDIRRMGRSRLQFRELPGGTWRRSTERNFRQILDRPRDAGRVSQDAAFSDDDDIQTLLAKPQPLRPQYADPELLELQAAQG